MTTVLHPTGSTATSPVGAQYNSVDRVMIVTVNGAPVVLTVEQFAAFLEAGCHAFDCRSTAHPFDFDRAATLIHHARTADLAVA